MDSHDWPSIRSRVLDFIAAGWDAPVDDASFDAVARDVFTFQYQHNTPYRAWCSHRNRTPRTVEHWSRIPAVPTGAFKEVALVTGDVARAEAVFRTSGTTLGEDRRGTNYVRDISVYHASLRASFEAMLLPDGARPIFASLLPPAAEMQDSSLAHMIDSVMEHFGNGGHHFASAGRGLDEASLDGLLRACERNATPVCLLGTSLSFVHWLDALGRAGSRYRLPAGSRLMDTGGFKGRRRAVAEDDLRIAYTDYLGIPGDACINEYGMTEMASQFYDSPLRDAHTGEARYSRRKLGAAWVRTRIVDPDTLEELPAGHTGLLQHFDLANVGSVVGIQTEDLGVTEGDGFRLLGRATGAPPRGCSIAMDELLSAVRD